MTKQICGRFRSVTVVKKPVGLLAGSVGAFTATFRLLDWNEFEVELKLLELW
jgi:hypothetical protein